MSQVIFIRKICYAVAESAKSLWLAICSFTLYKERRLEWRFNSSNIGWDDENVPRSKVGHNIPLCSSVPQPPYSRTCLCFWEWKACRRQHGSTVWPSNWVLFDQCSLSKLCNDAVHIGIIIDESRPYTLPVHTGERVKQEGEIRS